MNQSKDHTFYVNGRFLTRPSSGVERVAIELIISLANRSDTKEIILLTPMKGILHLDWMNALEENIRSKITIQRVGPFTGHIWEQLVLPLVSVRGYLLNFCSTGPILRRRQLVMIHDAQVWDAPESYSWPFKFLYRLIIPFLAQNAEIIATASDTSARRLEKLGIAPPGKLIVVNNGADHILRIVADYSVFERIKLTCHNYIIAIGSLAPHKNLRLLIRAAGNRPEQAPELIIVGGLNKKIFLDADLDELPGVRFVGRVTDEELRALYEGAIALAFPSKTEGFGLPPVEAMLCGCPVIATTGGAVPEVCGDAVIYADPDDTDAWTEALTEIAANSQLRFNLIERGYIRAKRYNWIAAAETVLRAVPLRKGLPSD
ncbi:MULTISPECIES: glycosyltransferase family 1 protein [unclassified Pannonibacter]|uniref:glycosyltransferase family 4 protein n=1 Tax=unclassified Pannonibacter TaxID=2627228 RepID=UPI0016481F1E|nr:MULTISPECIES: glycosyltransferase family 1 protein [unclassified Pannonibacter]